MDVDRRRSTLTQIARRAMIERGSPPDLSRAALAELDRIPDPRAAEIVPMLPGKLSTDLASPGYREDRPAIVIGPQAPRATGPHGRGAGAHRLHEGRLR